MAECNQLTPLPFKELIKASCSRNVLHQLVMMLLARNHNDAFEFVIVTYKILLISFGGGHDVFTCRKTVSGSPGWCCKHVNTALLFSGLQASVLNAYIG